jgi:hypothetical protein
MKQPLDFDDAGASDDEPVRGVLMGHIRQWHDQAERLKLALEPFVALRDQSPSQMAKIIHKGVDGLTPIALTVTKDQFKAACVALSSHQSATQGE